jgi:hypothetical protein
MIKGCSRERFPRYHTLTVCVNLMHATNQMLILKFTLGINNPEETDQKNAKSLDFEAASPLPVMLQAVPVSMAPMQMYPPYATQVYAVCVCMCVCACVCVCDIAWASL